MRLDSAKCQCSIYFCWINSSLQIFFGTKTAKTLIVFSLYKSWIYVNFKYFLLIKYCYLFSLQVIFEIFTCTFKHKILVISIFEVKWSKQLNCIYQQQDISTRYLLEAIKCSSMPSYRTSLSFEPNKNSNLCLHYHLFFFNTNKYVVINLGIWSI